MAGTVTALEFQKGNKERVNVYLDGTFAFGLPATIAATHLRRGQMLSDAEIAALRALDEQERAYEQAVRFLRYRPRSRTEVERYLRRKRFAEETITRVMTRLQDAGYLDDEAFARFWVENRQHFRPRSRRALGIELRQKGVEQDIVQEVVDEQDDEEAAWQAVEAQLSRWGSLSREQLQRRLGDFLARRGFDYATIRAVYRRACQVLCTKE
ncbi:MAG: RecX family transcriptional regulator [Ardenticatenia bacterium]|jgi:regulatory protein|nr:MAG: RecX family transcriptional regulator [Ardenticatenia bacterium]